MSENVNIKKKLVKKIPKLKYEVEHLICLKSDEAEGSFIEGSDLKGSILYDWHLDDLQNEDNILRMIDPFLIQIDVFERKLISDRTKMLEGVIKYIPVEEFPESVITGDLIEVKYNIDIEISFEQSDKTIILKDCKFWRFIHNGLSLDISFAIGKIKYEGV